VYRGIAELTPGAWNTITLTVPAGAAMPMWALGMEFATSGGWSGTGYIDTIAW
jgi:hypothetical protein